MKNNWKTLYIPLLVFVAIVFFFSRLLMQSPALNQAQSIDRPLPTFTVKNNQGVRYTPQDIDDEIDGAYVMNFFSSWCVPCKAEHSLLMQLAKDGIPIVGMNYKDVQADRNKFLTKMGNPYALVLVDDQGLMSIPFGISGVPETFVVSKDGRLIWQWKGALTDEGVEQIKAMLKK